MHSSVRSRPLRRVYAVLLSFLLFVVPTLSREETPAPTGHISNSALVVKMPPSALKKRQQENVPVSDDATSKTPLFASVDADKDGYLEVDELNKFIKQVIGGSDFDEQEEIVSGVTDVLENVLDVTVDSTSTKEVTLAILLIVIVVVVFLYTVCCLLCVRSILIRILLSPMYVPTHSITTTTIQTQQLHRSTKCLTVLNIRCPPPSWPPTGKRWGRNTQWTRWWIG